MTSANEAREDVEKRWKDFAAHATGCPQCEKTRRWVIKAIHDARGETLFGYGEFGERLAFNHFWESACGVGKDSLEAWKSACSVAIEVGQEAWKDGAAR